MSFVPTFGSVLSAVLNKSRSYEAESVECVKEFDHGVFVGVTTRSGEGIVDTAAQDGLIGKAALLALTETLRGYGLQIRWNTQKRAQASGVGGRATVLGIAELPVGIAGVNGLLEVTAVQDNVPLLLPIKLLRQLEAIVDLDQNILHLKAYGVQTDMQEMPSGHMSVSVTSYADGGWKLPHAAASENLEHDQYVLVTSGFLNHSMSPLEGTKLRSAQFDIGDGAAVVASHDGAKRPGRADVSWRTECSSASKPEGHDEVASDRRQDDPAHVPCGASRRGVGLATKWLAAAVGTGVLASQSFYPAGYDCHAFGQAAGVRSNREAWPVSWNPQNQGSSDGEGHGVSPSGSRAERSWESVLQGGVVWDMPSKKR